MTDTSSGITNQMLRIWMRPDGIIQQVWEPRAAIELDHAVSLPKPQTRLFDDDATALAWLSEFAQ